MNRAPRSTRSELAAAEAQQNLVIAALHEAGQDDLADRLTMCSISRTHRDAGWPAFLCRSAGCWHCRRAIMRRWWRRLMEWCDCGAPATSLAVISIADNDPFAGIRRLRRGARDVRDRAARHQPRYRDLACGGLLSDRAAMLLVHHPSLSRSAVGMLLAKRWPNAVLSDPEGAEPSFELSIENAVALAKKRRGIQPLTMVVPSQREIVVAPARVIVEPMPILF